jgi:hypothetical protein
MKTGNDSLDDLSTIEHGEHTREEWAGLIRAMDSGDTVIVSATVADYFLGVLPPARYLGPSAFAFCEGDDRFTLFARVRDQWLMRTLTYGERSTAVLQDRLREMRDAYERHLHAAPAAV